MIIWLWINNHVANAFGFACFKISTNEGASMTVAQKGSRPNKLINANGAARRYRIRVGAIHLIRLQIANRHVSMHHQIGSHITLFDMIGNVLKPRRIAIPFAHMRFVKPAPKQRQMVISKRDKPIGPVV